MAIRSSLVAMVALSSLFLIGSLLAGTEAVGTMPGGLKDVSNFANSVEIDDLANFAVDQYKTRQNSLSVAGMTFSKVVAAKEQVVQGTMYYLTVEVMEDGKPKLYDAKVWVKPWEGYKELESFVPSVSQIDTAAKADCSHKNQGIETVT
jgi:acyl-CoA hydrolase